MLPISLQEILGLSDSHLVTIPEFPQHRITSAALPAFQQLIANAEKAGVAIALISSWRSFEYQSKIWNAKWNGHRPILSRNGRLLNTEALTDIEKLKAITCWSAIPGTSRHHWGTDFDLFSQRAIDEGHHVELTPDEFSSQGVCCDLNHWLQENLQVYGFSLPYDEYRRGIAEEPWHISFHSIASQIVREFPITDLRTHLEKSDVLGRSMIIEMLEWYYEKFMLNINPQSLCE